MSANSLIIILLLAPLAGFLFNGLRFRSRNYLLSGVVASAAVFVSFVCALLLLGQLLPMDPLARKISVRFFEWIVVGNFYSTVGFVVDPISIVMTLIITGVGTLIHIFSIGYMSHDERPSKYFAYLNLFIFNMLLLVLGENLLLLFVGWEGVGLCSYLLIGFWFSDAAKAAAGMKAFITNRIGDAGFLIGMFILFMTFGSIDFSELALRSSNFAEVGWTGPVTAACLFLFIGAAGKSAQIPLHVWLPDAMAGPTPVSALIHAATMVTAGVYMIVRLSPIFMMAPNALHVVAVVGALTAVMAAAVGMTQWDIKKVLAYSTVSQLGYMFMACGVGAFSAAMFHLMTHAFFKALMFLGSGSVIHAMHEEQDIRKMGGLRKYLPITHLTFVCGWWAIIGMPPFAGFFSKDEILWLSFHSPLGNSWLWLMGFVGALLTSFYMTRLMCLTFWGKSRVAASVHPHESPWTMTVPLMVLAALSVVGGWIGIPHVIGGALGHIPNFFEHWVANSMALPELPEASVTMEVALMIVSVVGAGVSALLAYHFYVRDTSKPQQVVAQIPSIYALADNKFRFDEVYTAKVIHPLIYASKVLWIFIDVQFIDRMTFWIAAVARELGNGFRSLQNGNLQTYASFVLYGVVASVLLMMWWG